MISRVFPCVIFNPAAKGEKARRFRADLDHIAGRSVFKCTAGPGDARRLSAEALRDGHDTVVAVGGDGTLNEVLNGMGDVAGGFQQARLGVVPLGTVNVFARELGIPLQPEAAWAVVERGQDTRVDLPWLEHTSAAPGTRHYFTQLAGAGLDARAIELVQWKLKRRVGPLAYVVAGLRAMRDRQVPIEATTTEGRLDSPLVLIGNGRLYGGTFRVFPEATLTDGKLHVCALRRVDWWTLLQCAVPLLLARRLPERVVRRMTAQRVRLDSGAPAGVQIDGEHAGPLPVGLGVDPLGLRVLA